MRILLLTDLHSNRWQSFIPRKIMNKCNFIISTGDIEIYDFPLDCIGVYGNHELLIEPFILKKLISCDRKILKYKGFTFTGFQGNLAKHIRKWHHFTEAELNEYYNFMRKEKLNLDFFLTHERAWGIFDIRDFGGKAKHLGIKLFRKFVENLRPKYYLSGHIQNPQGIVKVNSTICINPGEGSNNKYAILFPDLKVQFYEKETLMKEIQFE